MKIKKQTKKKSKKLYRSNPATTQWFAATLCLLLAGLNTSKAELIRHECICLSAQIKTEKAIAIALENNLYKDNQWLALLHYNTEGSLVSSRIDDPAFFLNSSGKSDPKAELISSIELLYNCCDQQQITNFSSRTLWLTQKLNNYDNDLNVNSCFISNHEKPEPSFDKLLLAFPVPSSKSLATSFGHLFLVFVKSDSSILFSPTISYMALIDTDFNFMYPLYGLAGKYKSFYMISDYAERLRSYNAYALRDVWEYEIDISQEKIMQLYSHACDLRGIYSFYYFLNKNCASELISLLRVAVPDQLSSVGEGGLFITPIETIKYLKKKGLIAKTTYRPSLLTSLRAGTFNQSDEIKKLVLELSNNPALIESEAYSTNTNLNLITDSAISLLALKAAQKPEAAEYHHKLIRQIVEKSTTTENSSVNVDQFVQDPTYESLPNRLDLGISILNKSPALSLRYRPLQSDVLDPPRKVLHFSTVELFSIYSRIESADDIFASIDLIHSRSFIYSDLLYKPFSTEIKITADYYSEDDESSASLLYGFGYSYLVGSSSLIYSFIDTLFSTDREFNEDHVIFGPRIGQLLNPSDNTRFHYFFNAYYLPSEDDYYFKCFSELAYYTSDNTYLSINAVRVNPRYDKPSTEIQLSFRILY